MRLTFLGTSAGEGYPAIWCDCPYCRYAREKAGKNLRYNSCAVLDGDVLLDMNANCFSAAQRFGVDLLGVRHLFVTHDHQDHFFPQHLVWRSGPYTMGPGEDFEAPIEEVEPWLGQIGPRFSPLPELDIYGSASIAQAIDAHPRLSMENLSRIRARFTELSRGQVVQAGDMRVTAVTSHHGTPGMTYNYIIERGGKTLLYALDTGGYDEDMLDILRAHRYDCVVLEGTFGHSPLDLDMHMSTRKDLSMLAFFTENGLWKGKPNMVLSHMAPHWTPPHDMYEPEMAAHGVTVAYDGLTVEV
ncbi:hypothetical protein LJC74_03285 [Eubacteriales bacterium OttesenSCG-928-A19]|nr:hypothetical protein [Eubacteriales bacterium OttesenSCG-928-A19]